MFLPTLPQADSESTAFSSTHHVNMASFSAPGEWVSHVTQHLVFCCQLKSMKILCMHENEPCSFYFLVGLEFTLSCKEF